MPLFEDRILRFDLTAAEFCAQLRARARIVGEGVGTDSSTAAIAAVTSFTGTRDTQPFEAMGVKVINPWKSE